MDQKNLGDLYNLDPIPWSVAPAAMGPLRNDAEDGLRRPHGRPRRCHSLAFLSAPGLVRAL